MNTLDKRYYNAVLNQPDYETAVYNFIKSLNNVEEVRYLWQNHFSPDDNFMNHCFGMACWSRIKELRKEETQMRYTIDIWYYNQYQGNWKNCGYSFPSRIDAKLWMMIEHPNIREDGYRIREV